MIDYYAILGVSRSATQIEVRDAYLRLARDTHPDKVQGVEARKRAEDTFKNVTAAYDTLSKERSRRDYTNRLPPDKDAKPVAKIVSPKAKVVPPVVQGQPLPPREPAPPPAAGTSGPIRSGPVNFDALAQGIDAFKKQDYHTAVQLLNMAVTQNAQSAQAHAMLGFALAKNPNWVRDAMQHLETASKLDPKNVSYMVELALLLHAQGLKLRAKRTIESASALAPNHPDVARGMKEILPDAPPSEAPSRPPAEQGGGLFGRLRKR